MRGNRPTQNCPVCRRGPIPACAGQPGFAAFCPPVAGAYPRVCGATYFFLSMPFVGKGLSPRVRGNRGVHSTLPGLPRPIPACAGQPRDLFSGASITWAYPRVCGATDTQSRRGMDSWGLSPRVRGNRQAALSDDWFCGPIPACAGQPLRLPGTVVYLWAYPRVCGATGRWKDLGQAHRGLSPRVRGNRSQVALYFAIFGPIPACAGQPWR